MRTVFYSDFCSTKQFIQAYTINIIISNKMFKWYLSLRGNITFDSIWLTVCYCHVSWICLQNRTLKWTFWPHIWSFKCLTVLYYLLFFLSLFFLFSNLSFIIQIARIQFCSVQYDLKKKTKPNMLIPLFGISAIIFTFGFLFFFISYHAYWYGHCLTLFHRPIVSFYTLKCNF